MTMLDNYVVPNDELICMIHLRSISSAFQDLLVSSVSRLFGRDFRKQAKVMHAQTSVPIVAFGVHSGPIGNLTF
jgi:hypothetical protein